MHVLTVGIGFAVILTATSLIVLARDRLTSSPRRPRSSAAIMAFAYCCTCLACSLLGMGYTWVPAACLAVSTSLLANRWLSDFTPGARLMFVAYPMLTLLTAIWAASFLVSLHVSSLTLLLMAVLYALALLAIPASLVGRFAEWEGLGRRVWRRPRMPLAITDDAPRPMVSLHVPTYAEPPELVIATLDALARLNYPNFEVLVIDNNTSDASLWGPVQQHCQRLGARFRFFHIPVLTGAKAGAVNLALAHTAPDAELIGVLDSDYRAEPDFLERLVGFFDDAQIGFVQTPHDYRDWQDSLYQRFCYWEYAYGVKNLLPALNEHGAAYTIGTMCLIRRSALEEAGGWAEWCLTEDSELAIRLHAHGYSGIYLATTFGRGLIPETFLSYKNQRFRWACGPVQQLRRHLGLLMPHWPGKRHTPGLTTSQKIHELSHGLGLLNTGLGLGSTACSGLLIASMLIHHESVAIPSTLWAIVIAKLSVDITMSWLTHRVLLGCSIGETVGAFIARSALSYTIAVASISGLFNDTALWRRTNKFPMLPAGIRALNGVWVELGLGLAAVSAGMTGMIATPELGVTAIVSAGVLYQGLRFLAAPALAILAERDIQRHQRSVLVAVPSALSTAEGR